MYPTIFSMSKKLCVEEWVGGGQPHSVVQFEN